MFTFDQLRAKVTAYCDGLIDFGQFEEWFRVHSWGYYDRSGERLSDAIAAVHAALVSYESDDISDEDFRSELADTISDHSANSISVLVTVPEAFRADRHFQIYKFLEAEGMNTCWVGSRSSTRAERLSVSSDPQPISATRSVSLECAVS